MVTVLYTIVKGKLAHLPFGYLPAEQHFLEAWFAPDGDEPDLLFTGGLQADPSLSGNEHQRAWLGVVLFVFQPHVSAARLDQENLILRAVFVLLDSCAGRDRNRRRRCAERIPGGRESFLNGFAQRRRDCELA